MATSTTALLGFMNEGSGLPTDPGVTDELSNVGIGFGQLMESIGSAVGETQLELNRAGAATASALATTKVDVIAVRETVLDDKGVIHESKDHVRKLPLINFIDPVFYEWSNVRLQGQFYARELASASKRRQYQGKGGSSFGQSGLLLIFGGGSSSAGSRTSEDIIESDTTADTSVGRVRMNSILTPKADVGVPKPRLTVRGPIVNILQGEIQDVFTGETITARTMTVTLEYYRPNGDPIPNKQLSIAADGASWSFPDGSTGVTDVQGALSIQLRREFIGENPDRTPADVVVTAGRGLVSNSVTVTF